MRRTNNPIMALINAAIFGMELVFIGLVGTVILLGDSSVWWYVGALVVFLVVTWNTRNAIEKRSDVLYKHLTDPKK